MKIKIEVLDEDDNVLVSQTSLSFESASEALGKLERYITKKQYE